MTELPAPFVPADLDLRSCRWMKFDILALTSSEFNQTHNDSAWRAGVTLWCRAWHQVPCGSLPDNDNALCGLAGLGRDIKAWMRMRGDALHGFVRCSDGRLYNRTLCGFASEVFKGRVGARDRMRDVRSRNKAATSDEREEPLPERLYSPSPSNSLSMSKNSRLSNKGRERSIGLAAVGGVAFDADGEDF